MPSATRDTLKIACSKSFVLTRKSEQFGTELLKFNYKEAFPTVKFPDGQQFYSDLDKIAVCPGNECLVLLNIKRCIVVLLTIKPNYKAFVPQLLNLKSAKITSNLEGATFSGDGKYILVSEGHFLHVWTVENLGFMATLTLHSVDSFPLAVDRHSSRLATSSQIHTAIKIWDLSHIQSCSGKQIELYENPLDHVAPCPARRLVLHQEIPWHGVAIWLQVH